MTRKNKKYDKEFKLEASKLVTQHGYSYAEAALQLGLEDWAIRGWVKACGEFPQDGEDWWSFDRFGENSKIEESPQLAGILAFLPDFVFRTLMRQNSIGGDTISIELAL